MNKIIIGHNQFFGINHFNAKKGAETASKFSDPKSVVLYLREALERGFNEVMFSTHPRVQAIALEIQKDPVLLNSLNISILLPYIAKYVEKANELGVVKTLFDMAKSSSLKTNYSFFSATAKNIFGFDSNSLLEALIRAELESLKNLKINRIYLHNSVSDLVASFQMFRIYEHFDRFIRKLGYEPAICTLNFPTQKSFLKGCDVSLPAIMSPFNPLGHQMNPGRLICEDAAKDYEGEIIAMSVMASGQIDATAAITYLKTQNYISNVILGSSKVSNLSDFKNKIKLH
jgi:hypothetical protein